MELALRIRADEGLLYATYSGDFSLGEAQRTFLQILEALQRHQVQKVLVDGRALAGEPKTMDRFLYGKFVAEKVRKQRDRIMCPKFAYVLVTPVLDPQRFGETVAVNRGMFVKTFDNLDDALEWLEID
jgi:hypothetical protein